MLLRISTAGVYLPWVLEAHIDAGLHPLQHAFTLTHEATHAYGFTDEGVCNFWAYVATHDHSNLYIRYAGLLTYWRYLASSYRKVAPEAYRAYRREEVPTGISNDLMAIYRNGQQYPDILPAVRDRAYDTYLKSQGVKEGLQSYSRVVLLVQAWRSNVESGTYE